MTDLTKGRGAFTSVGKDNEMSWYGYKKNKPMDGSTPAKGFNYEAVNLGVLSIEQRLASMGYDLKVDGIYGPRVKLAVMDFQERSGLPISGEIGFTTGPELWRDYLATTGLTFPQFPTSLIWGIMRSESGGDPGAVGYDTPGDRGLFQFNTLLPTVSVAEAHDYSVATDIMFTRFAGAWNRYKGKGSDIRESCSIIQHKSPVAADEWFKNGVSPGPISSDYVSKVRAFSVTF